MPNDATHRIINYFMLSMFLVANFYIGFEDDFRKIIVFIGAYVLGTEIFTPDLDTDSKPRQRLGILSYPIRRLSMHRGLGHNLFVGWLLKALYILLIFIIMGVIIFTIAGRLGYNIYWILGYIDINSINAFLTGLFLSNAVHIIADNI